MEVRLLDGGEGSEGPHRGRANPVTRYVVAPRPQPASDRSAPGAAPAGWAAPRRCRRCGAELQLRGAFYWHSRAQPRCPVTCWPAGSVEGAPRTDRLERIGRAAGGRPPGGTARPEPAGGAEGAHDMSKRGGNKAKRPPKPAMPNKGPKRK
jgi:hypothetical protein